MTQDERQRLCGYNLRDAKTLTDDELGDYEKLLRKSLAELNVILKGG